VSAWISVEDRLPEENEIVIVSGGIACLLGGVWHSQTGIDTGRPIQWELTHWMPLPDAPEGE